MPQSAKAFQFWVKPTEGATAIVAAAIAEGVGGHNTFRFGQHDKDYLARDLSWSSRTRILTGTVYLVRSDDLPSAIMETEVEPLPIDDDTDIGEPMCFALHPDVGVAVVHYAHTGPRHSVMSMIVGEFVPDQAISVQPVIRTDMLQKLRQKQFLRALQFTLTDPRGIQELRAMGGSVSNALSMIDDVGGVTIKVEVTMGHTRGEGLIANTAKPMLENLLRIGTENVEGHKGVTSLKVRASDGVDAPVEQLDLLKAREEILLAVDEAGRYLDTAKLCRKLRSKLTARLPALRHQAGM